jgi:hypothetical protein
VLYDAKENIATNPSFHPSEVPLYLYPHTHAFVHFQSADIEGLSIRQGTPNVEIVYIIRN